MTDINLIRDCLKRCKRIALQFRRGGLNGLLQHIEAALEALDRIEQPDLFGKEEQ